MCIIEYDYNIMLNLFAIITKVTSGVQRICSGGGGVFLAPPWGIFGTLEKIAEGGGRNCQF